MLRKGLPCRIRWQARVQMCAEWGGPDKLERKGGSLKPEGQVGAKWR